MIPVLFVSCSQFSGSTLTSFLLGTHPKICSIGHATGWSFPDDEVFPCSCGEPIDICPFYGFIAAEFKKHGLQFDVRRFGTAFEVSAKPRLNRILLENLPMVRRSGIENLRDACVYSVPFLKRKLETQQAANAILFGSSIAYWGAEIFLDNSHDPYRLRHLNRARRFDLKNIHLVRDPRGVVLSIRKRTDWDIRTAARVWLRRQEDIIRISKEIPASKLVFYEDLCAQTNEVLAEIHQFVGLSPHAFDGNFKATEHHILGNQMRLQDGTIRSDERWKSELPPESINLIERYLKRRSRKSAIPELQQILEYYF